MKRIIYKYPLQITDVQVLELPQARALLHVGIDAMKQLCLWYEVDAVQRMEGVIFYIIGTGQPMHPKARTHLGSAVMPNGLVWHIYTN